MFLSHQLPPWNITDIGLESRGHGSERCIFNPRSAFLYLCFLENSQVLYPNHILMSPHTHEEVTNILIFK